MKISKTKIISLSLFSLAAISAPIIFSSFNNTEIKKFKNTSTPYSSFQISINPSATITTADYGIKAFLVNLYKEVQDWMASGALVPTGAILKSCGLKINTTETKFDKKKYRIAIQDAAFDFETQKELSFAISIREKDPTVQESKEPIVAQSERIKITGFTKVDKVLEQNIWPSDILGVDYPTGFPIQIKDVEVIPEYNSELVMQDQAPAFWEALSNQYFGTTNYRFHIIGVNPRLSGTNDLMFDIVPRGSRISSRESAWFVPAGKQSPEGLKSSYKLVSIVIKGAYNYKPVPEGGSGGSGGGGAGGGGGSGGAGGGSGVSPSLPGKPILPNWGNDLVVTKSESLEWIFIFGTSILVGGTTIGLGYLAYYLLFKKKNK